MISLSILLRIRFDFACFDDLSISIAFSVFTTYVEQGAAGNVIVLQPTKTATSSTAQGGGGSFKHGKPIGEVGCCESRMAERSH